MNRRHIVSACLAGVWLALLPRVSAAADYTWTGLGGDGNWRTADNWGGVSFPCAAGDIATVTNTAPATLHLNTNGIVTLGRLQLTSSTPKTLTVTGNAGSGFSFSGLAAGQNGFSVGGSADNRLVVEPAVTLPVRADKQGAGTLEFKGGLTCALASGYALVLWNGLTVFSGTSSLSAASTDLGLANGGGQATVILTNQTQLSVSKLNLGASTAPAASATVYQDSDDSSVTVGNEMVFGLADSGTDEDDVYYLRKGSLTAAKLTIGAQGAGRLEVSGGTLAVNTTLAVKWGTFLQTGGVSVLGGAVIGTTDRAPSFTLAGGRMLLNGAITNGWVPERQSFVFSGGILQNTNTCSVSIPLTLGETVTFDAAVAGKANTLTRGLSVPSGTTLVKTGPGTLLLGNGTTNEFSGTVIISNGVFQLGECAVLRSHNQSEEPLHVKICSNAVFRLTDITSLVPVPLDLEIEEGGKIDMFYTASYYNRNLLIARSITYKGTPLAAGRYTTDNGFITGITKSCSVVIPIRWTGLGDGVTWDQAANWEGANVPNATTEAADLSAAQGTIRLDSAITLTCLIHSPADRERQVTLTGDGSIILYGGNYTMPCGYVGEGCRLTLDVPLDRYSAALPLGILLGGGTLTVKKGFPSSGNNSAGYASVSVFGTLVFAGQTDIAKYLDLWHHEANSKGLASVVFTNGCRLTCARIMNAPKVFSVVARVCHDGGEVTCGDIFFSRYSEPPVLPYAYYMRSGTLTTTNAYGINLGVECPDLPGTWLWGSVRTDGSFIMSGGTVATERFAMGLPSNVIDLHGGEVFLGAGGIVKTGSVAQGSVKLGGVAIRSAADWGSGLKMELTGEAGNTVIDTEGHTVTLSNALSGAGGLTKAGAGTLVLSGATNTFAGTLAVAAGTLECAAGAVFNGLSSITVTNGTLSLNGTVLSAGITLSLAGTGALALPAGKDLAVDRLYLNGVLQPAGTYPYGDGTVTVNPTAKTVWTGAAADGALWGTLNNWSNTVAVPDGANVALDFGYSALATNQQIVLDVTPGVALTNLTYSQGVPGCALTITCPSGATNTLTFSANGVIRVEEGQTLVLDANVYLSGHLYKTGAGTLVLNRRTYSGDATGAFSLFITEGKAIGRGEFNRVRVQPASGSLMAPPPEFTLEGTDAALRDAVMALPGYLNTGADQGTFTQSGGLVDLSTVPAAFTNAKSGFIIAGGVGTRGNYNLEGGTLVTCSNQPSYLSGDSASGTFNQSGGTSTFYRLNLTRPWPATGGSGVLNLSGGTLRLVGLAEKGYSAGAVNLSGGRVETSTNGVSLAADVPVTLATGGSGDVSFAQAQAGQTNTLAGTLSGAGGLAQEGPGTLALAGVNAFSGTASVKGGTLLVGSALENATGLLAAGGHLALLAAAPSLTNLAVRAASATARIGSAATPLAEGLTLDLAKGSVTELNFAGIVEVGQLVLDGRAKRPGLYGGVGSAAPASPYTAYFTGTGTLRVLSGPQPQGSVILLQ